MRQAHTQQGMSLMELAVTLLVLWTSFLLGFWALGVPLGTGASYVYPAG